MTRCRSLSRWWWEPLDNTDLNHERIESCLDAAVLKVVEKLGGQGRG